MTHFRTGTALRSPKAQPRNKCQRGHQYRAQTRERPPAQQPEDRRLHSLARANSTIRCVFAASPTSTTKPICVKMLLSPFDSQTPAIAESNRHWGINSTANGSDQLLYCAAGSGTPGNTANGKIYSAGCQSASPRKSIGPFVCHSPQAAFHLTIFSCCRCLSEE